mmetsp:Transcript_70865/g.196876  ORF Transcript_70865/g.196876 Transcript_70865/m.196876 type:complete len:238 (+) Transcript_70865:716-1429(+)
MQRDTRVVGVPDFAPSALNINFYDRPINHLQAFWWERGVEAEARQDVNPALSILRINLRDVQALAGLLISSRPQPLDYGHHELGRVVEEDVTFLVTSNALFPSARKHRGEKIPLVLGEQGALDLHDFFSTHVDADDVFNRCIVCQDLCPHCFKVAARLVENVGFALQLLLLLPHRVFPFLQRGRCLFKDSLDLFVVLVSKQHQLLFYIHGHLRHADEEEATLRRRDAYGHPSVYITA